MEYADINERLLARIKELGLKKNFLARKFCISPPYFGYMLAGKAAINRDIFLEMVGYLGLDARELRKQFPLDFSISTGEISARGYRLRDKRSGF